MATATATMDDLVASLGGSMHVSPDLKALQEYLAQNMVRPSIPLSSPNVGFRPIPPSRSTSSTRKPTSLPSSYIYPDSNMMMQSAYPSPISQTSFSSFPDLNEGPSSSMMMNVSTPTNIQRPGGPLRRTSSYGFGCSLQVAPSSPPTTYSSFDSDAFAPLWQQQQNQQQQNQQQQQQQQQSQDPWAKIRSQAPNAFAQYNNGGNPLNAAPSQSSSFGVFRQPQGFGLNHQHQNGFQQIGGSPPTPPAEDDEAMDEDCIDAEMDDYDDEEEDRVERVMGLTSMDGRLARYESEDAWGRGRMKF